MFTDIELDYLNSQPIGRLCTLSPSGAPQARPVGFTVTGTTIDIGGFDLPATRKYRNVQHDGRVTFLIDDLATTDPWRPRGIEIRGRAEAIGGDSPVIRVRPERIITWGLDSAGDSPIARRAD
ncbi:MAG TPA: PPOX class F420-dependent oxidoreductase [Mycobacteriales bacterium]|nr:PPOX class F420-dependent oxidoreductase [Mycobacteriales bacterium]